MVTGGEAACGFTLPGGGSRVRLCGVVAALMGGRDCEYGGGGCWRDVSHEFNGCRRFDGGAVMYCVEPGPADVAADVGGPPYPSEGRFGGEPLKSPPSAWCCRDGNE
jgi:hypothetical protein